MHQRRYRRFVSALLLSFLLFIGSTLIWQPPAASAHSFVIGSDPIDGSTIDTVPAVVRIYFNGPISKTLSVARVSYVQDGNFVDISDGPAFVPANNPRELDVKLRTPTQQHGGSYAVHWTAVSVDDGHTTYGLIGFDVGFSATGLSGTPILGPSTSNSLEGAGGIRSFSFLGGLTIAWDWFLLIALTCWIGILVTERLVLAATDRTSVLLERARKQAFSLQWLSLIILLVGEVVSLILRTIKLSQVQDGTFNPLFLWGMLTDTHYGLLWVPRLLLLCVALGVLYHVKRHPSSHLNTTALWFTLAGLITLSSVLSGAAVQGSEPRISAILLDWLYQVALGAWFGGLAYLGYILLPHLLAGDLDYHAETITTLLRRFPPIILTSMGVVLVSSIFSGETNITDLRQLVSDSYGRVLTIQAVLVLLLIVLSLYMVFVQRPMVMRRAMMLRVVDAELPGRRTRQAALAQGGNSLKYGVSIQAWLGIGVLLCTALMTFYTPPLVFPPLPANANATTTTNMPKAQTNQVGDLAVTLQVLPGKFGDQNSIIITLTDRNGQFVSNAQVEVIMNMLVMDMGTTQQKLQANNGIYTMTLDKGKGFTMAGLWSIALSLQLPGQAPQQTTFRVTIH